MNIKPVTSEVDKETSNPIENFSKPMKELIGFKSSQCTPPGDKQLNWVENQFKPLIDELADDVKNQVILVDMLFARVIDDLFYGGVVIRNGMLDGYLSILAQLFSSNISIGTHPEFQKGILDTQNNEDRFIFSKVNNYNSTDKKEFICQYLDHTQFNGLDGNWKKQVSDKSLSDSWHNLINLILGNLPSITHLAGIPIVVPRHGKFEGFPVAALFIGVNSKDDNEAFNAVKTITPRLVTFALQTYAIRKAELTARHETDLLQARIFQSIQKDIKNLIDQAAALRSTSLKIQASISISKEDFLGHYQELSAIFESNSKDYTYKWEAEWREGNCFCVDIFPPYETPKKQHTTSSIDILPDRAFDSLESADNEFPEAKSGFETKYDHFSSSHSDSHITPIKWKEISKYLKLYGECNRIDLFQDFNAPDNDKKCRNLHKLLKLMVQRPHASPHSLFEPQIAVACANAWRDIKKIVSLIVNNKNISIKYKQTGDNNNRDGIDLENFTQALSKTELHCNDSEALCLPDGVRADEFLGALMRLIRVELREAAGPSHQMVTASQLEIIKCEKHTDITILCSGIFKDKNLLFLEETADFHGLRSCLKVLCRAVGQRQLNFANTITLESLQQLANLSPSSQFILGEEETQGKQSKFFFRLPRKQAQQQTHESTYSDHAQKNDLPTEESKKNTFN